MICKTCDSTGYSEAAAGGWSKSSRMSALFAVFLARAATCKANPCSRAETTRVKELMHGVKK